jgi:hypothetical protein
MAPAFAFRVLVRTSIAATERHMAGALAGRGAGGEIKPSWTSA